MVYAKVQENETKEVSTVAVKRAYDYIRDMSIDFLIRPGEQINEMEVANQLKMSRVPVREALNRLVSERFVTFDSGKGFFCRKFSETEIKELYAVRFDLEIGSVRQACREGTDEDIAALIADWQENLKDYTTKSQEELIAMDEKFHIWVAALCGNKERISYLKNVFKRIRFIRKINIENDSRRNEFISEHIDILSAISKRDEEEATKLMDYHLGISSQELKDNIRAGMLRIYAADIS